VSRGQGTKSKQIFPSPAAQSFLINGGGKDRVFARRATLVPARPGWVIVGRANVALRVADPACPDSPLRQTAQPGSGCHEKITTGCRSRPADRELRFPPGRRRANCPGSAVPLQRGPRTTHRLGKHRIRADQTKETNSPVDIGFHYVATDASGNPLDYDGDSLPDYFEDKNGNGTIDSGGSDWRDPDTDDDGQGDGGVSDDLACYLEFFIPKARKATFPFPYNATNYNTITDLAYLEELRTARFANLKLVTLISIPMPGSPNWEPLGYGQPCSPGIVLLLSAVGQTGVAVHEYGHTFGLPHRGEARSGLFNCEVDNPGNPADPTALMRATAPAGPEINGTEWARFIAWNPETWNDSNTPHEESRDQSAFLCR